MAISDTVVTVRSYSSTVAYDDTVATVGAVPYRILQDHREGGKGRAEYCMYRPSRGHGPPVDVTSLTFTASIQLRLLIGNCFTYLVSGNCFISCGLLIKYIFTLITVSPKVCEMRFRICGA